ncbi:MAG TPA: winged helix-turn-helix transcriptional regulator [Candidatus Methanoperedenaceae archaeon]|nr:winged helix-turn-helix transcriptional regulator [Candidatus Methanoperedenaceae archaeon]
MIGLLHRKSEGTKFQILVEIAAHQPEVRQQEIAQKIGITPQAVSEHVKELASEGLLSAEGRVRYRVTKEGLDWILEKAQELKRYAKLVMEEVVNHASIWPAIAECDLMQGEKVYLRMREGLLYAANITQQGQEGAFGVTISGARKGEDVGVTGLKGAIGLEHAGIVVGRIPRIERGGSRNVDTVMLKKYAEKMPYIGALGVEALMSLRSIGVEPDSFFGVRESVVEAAFHGLSSFVVSVDDEVPALLHRLETEGLSYEVIDLRKNQ